MSNNGYLMKVSVAAFAATVLCSACGNDKEVSYKSGGMTHTFVEGAESVPKQFPIPLYPGATATGSVSSRAGEDEQSKYLMLTTNDAPDKVADFYKNELAHDGWQIDNSQVMSEEGKVVTISARKDKLEAQVLATEDSGKTTISVSLGQAGEITKEDTDVNNDDYKPDKVTPPTD